MGTAADSTSSTLQSLTTTANLSTEQLDEYREAFDIFDVNHDGRISRDELTKMMTQLGQMTSEEEITMIMKMADKDGKGFIDFESFVGVLKVFMPSDETELIRQAFTMMDKDGSGKISSAELKTVFMKTLGEKISDDDVDEIIRDIDLNGDGEVDYEEFLSVIRRKN